MDQIFINDLTAHGVIGVYEWERQTPQEILINLVLFTDTRLAAESDNLALSVDYEMVARKVLTYTEDAERLTVEALAADIAELCLQTPEVLRVRVRVEKPGVLHFARSVGVEIERDTRHKIHTESIAFRGN